ncbi:hypothetical protein FRB99_004029, partial [Tulasnella sp. 403]
MEFVKRNPESADRVALLGDAATGLAYLHKHNVVHGNIQGRNILVSSRQNAVLCGFECAVQDANGEGNWRFVEVWRAPELFILENATITPQSDVYAFGFTVYEVLNGKLPFDGEPIKRATLRALQGERPLREPLMSLRGESYTSVWTVAEACWRPDPSDRITAEEATTRLKKSREPVDANAADGGPPPTQPVKQQEPPVRRQTLGHTLLQSVFTPLLRAIWPPQTHASSHPFHTQLISKLAAISHMGNAAADVADLGDSIELETCTIHARAGHSDVYRAVLRPGRVMIAIKVLHAGNVQDSTELDLLAKRFGREMRVWKAMKHNHIVPLLGFAILPIGACLVSPWCANGNAMEYLKKFPDASRYNLILQVADGLIYLHTHDIVHGDIKA